jgi:hypothetical protein
MISSRVPIIILYLSLAQPLCTEAFSSVLSAHRNVVVLGSSSSPSSSSSSLRAFHLGDADITEELVGGELYEMVPLPDSMVDTTLFVGNLNEFVKDADLSDFFQSVSILQSVPACVIRRPNFDSMRYGFVAFPTVEEKEVSETKTAKTKTVHGLPMMLLFGAPPLPHFQFQFQFRLESSTQNHPFFFFFIYNNHRPPF